MKKKLFTILAIGFVAFSMTSFISCQEEENNPPSTGGDGPNVEGVKYEIIEDKILTAEEMETKIFGKDGANAGRENEEVIEAAREVWRARNKAREDSIADVTGQNGVATAYHYVVFHYYSTDVQGKPILLSAYMSWGFCDCLFFDVEMDQDRIFLYSHYTITSDAESPSVSKGGMEQYALVGDNLFIESDGIGFGKTKNQLQPYLNQEVSAINTIDALKAGYALFKNNFGGTMEDDFTTISVGCSQGAATALAVHKYFDTHPSFANEWHFSYSYTAAGPYVPAATIKKYYEWGALSYPIVLPMVLKSMIASYPDIMKGIKEEDFYTQKYLSHKTYIDGLFENKQLGSSDLVEKFGELFNKNDDDKVLLSEILNEKALDLNSDISKALMKCLEKNDLTTGWTPTHPIYLYHGEGDDIVPFVNSELVKSAFPWYMVILDRSHLTDGHILTCFKFMFTAW